NMVTPYQRFTTVDSAMEFIENFDREELDYDIDGLVVKSDQSNSLIKFGTTGHHPKNAFAIKFEAKGDWTKIIDIDWQVGRFSITPVAILEPVDIDGSTITRCTLHNYTQMEALGLTSIGSDYYHKTLVHVIKANDVIPKIIGTKLWIDEDWVKEKYNNDEKKIEEYMKYPSFYNTILIPPSACPECGVATEFTNGILKCINPECKGKLLNRITHMANREALDIVGLSEETAAKIIEAFPEIDHPAQVLCLTEEQIITLPGFAKKSAENLYNSIQKSCTATIDRVIYAAGMPLVGNNVSKDICDRFSIAELIANIDMNSKELLEIPGVGQKIVDSLFTNWNTMLTPFGDYMHEILEVPKKETKEVEKQLAICVTGSFEGVNRDYFKNLIEKAGHKFAKSLSKNTDYLLAGEKAGSKLANAKTLGVTVITTEKELLEIIQ
ncbi:MAG: BRCT domain-containing protein, partial [Paraclostridium sp.]